MKQYVMLIAAQCSLAIYAGDFILNKKESTPKSVAGHLQMPPMPTQRTAPLHYIETVIQNCTTKDKQLKRLTIELFAHFLPMIMSNEDDAPFKRKLQRIQEIDFHWSQLKASAWQENKSTVTLMPPFKPEESGIHRKDIEKFRHFHLSDFHRACKKIAQKDITVTEAIQLEYVARKEFDSMYQIFFHATKQDRMLAQEKLITAASHIVLKAENTIREKPTMYR